MAHTCHEDEGYVPMLLPMSNPNGNLSVRLIIIYYCGGLPVGFICLLVSRRFVSAQGVPHDPLQLPHRGLTSGRSISHGKEKEEGGKQAMVLLLRSCVQ